VIAGLAFVAGKFPALRTSVKWLGFSAAVLLVKHVFANNAHDALLELAGRNLITIQSMAIWQSARAFCIATTKVPEMRKSFANARQQTASPVLVTRKKNDSHNQERYSRHERQHESCRARENTQPSRDKKYCGFHRLLLSVRSGTGY